YRLKQAGCKLMLDPLIQVKHLKRWTFSNILKTDIFDRGIPWTELILRERRMPNDLNIQVSQRVSVALVFLTLALAILAAIFWRGQFLVPAFALLFFLLGRSWANTTSRAPLDDPGWYMLGTASLLAYLASRQHMAWLIPPIILTCMLSCAQRYGLVPRAYYAWVSRLLAGVLIMGV